MNYFARNISYLRNTRGLSKKELADKLKVNTSTISRWENSQMGATLENAVDIAKFFKITTFELLTVNLSEKNNDTSFIKRVMNSDDYGEDLLDIINLENILKKKGILSNDEQINHDDFQNLISFIRNNKELLIKKNGVINEKE